MLRSIIIILSKHLKARFWREVVTPYRKFKDVTGYIYITETFHFMEGTSFSILASTFQICDYPEVLAKCNSLPKTI